MHCRVSGIRRLVLPSVFLQTLLLAGLTQTASAVGGRSAAEAQASGSPSAKEQLRRGLAAYHDSRYAEAVAAWQPLAIRPDADAILLYRYAFALMGGGGKDSDVLRAQKRARKALESTVKKGGGPVECYYLAVLLSEKNEEAGRSLRLDCFKRLEPQVSLYTAGCRWVLPR